MRELWHAAGRAAREDRKRFVALQGVLFTLPVLIAAAFLWTLIAEGPSTAMARLARPFALCTGPLSAAYEGDHDGALLGYIAWMLLALQVPWAWFGTGLNRLAALDLTGGAPAFPQ